MRPAPRPSASRLCSTPARRVAGFANSATLRKFSRAHARDHSATPRCAYVSWRGALHVRRTRTGGGIFLSPLVIFMGWSETKQSSGVASVFILCNSIAGLLGNFAIVRSLPPDLPLYAGAVFAGALIGTTLGIRFGTLLILKALG